MNPLALLQVPWRSTHRVMRWLAVFWFALCLVGAVMLAVHAKHGYSALIPYATGLFYAWSFFFSTTLMLAIDARHLRLPGIQRQVVLSLLLYGTLCIALPAVAAAALGLSAALAALLAAAVSVGGLLFALLPRYGAIFVGMLPTLFHLPWQRYGVPAPEDPRFMWWSLAAVLLLLVVTALRWRRLLHTDSGIYQGWRSPVVFQFRNSSWGYWNNLGDSRLMLQRPDWLMPKINLDAVGPGRPRNTLRVALGGWYLPQTRLSYCKQLGMGLAIIALPLLCSLLLTTLDHHDDYAAGVLRGTLVGGLGSLGLVVGPLVCLFSLHWLRRRWQRSNAELPLLALLPGLGGAAQAKRQLVRTGLGLPLTLHAVPIALLLILFACWHAYAGILSFILLGQLGMTLTTCALVLNLFGGRPLSAWAVGATLVLVFVLSTLSMLLPVMAWGRHPVAQVVPLLPPLAVAWLLLAAVMLWLLRRGWRGLQQLPHAFLSI